MNQSEQSSGLGSAVLSFGNQADDQARFLFSFDAVAGAGKVGFYGNDVIGATLSTGTWHHLVWVWDGDTSRQYVDGALIVGPSPHTGASTAGTAGFIGSSTFRSPAYEFFMQGALDEVRVSGAARSGAWVSAEYNNQKPGSTLVKLGDPEPAP